MNIRKAFIASILILISFFQVKGQSYDLNLSTCVKNDTLFINVTTENTGVAFAFRSSDFVFDIYNSTDVRGAAGVPFLNFTNKVIYKQGLWSDSNIPNGIPDYQGMLLGGVDFFNVGVVEQDTLQAGINLTGAGIIDTIAIVAVPMSGNWCGEIISLRWRYGTRGAPYNVWPGAPTFGHGDINQWGVATLGNSIQANATFNDAVNIALCEGCNGIIANTDTLIQGDTTICANETLDFTVSPTTSDTVTFFVNSVLVQQGLNNSYTHTFTNSGVVDTVTAIIGDPSCLLCARTTDTTLVTINTSFIPSLSTTLFGCDSVQLLVEDVGTKYEWYQNGNLMGITFSPITSFDFNVALNDSFAVEIVGMSNIGICPDSTVLDTIITTVSGGSISVDLGTADTVVFCPGENVTFNSGFIHGGAVNVSWESPLGTPLGLGSTFSIGFTNPPPPVSRELFVVVDSAGCTGVDSVTGINNYVNAVINPNDSTYCDIDTLKLVSGTHPVTANTNWYFNNGLISSNDSIFVSSISNGGNGPGNYGLIISNTILGKTCADTTIRNITEIICNVNANFTLDDTVCINSINNIVLGNTSIGDTAWLWNFGSGATPATSTDSLPTNITYSTGGVKNVQLIIYGVGGTSDTLIRTIFVKGQMNAPVVSTLLNSSDSIVFNWTPVAGADGYNVYVSINGSPFGFEAHNIDSLNHYVLVNSLDTVCIRVEYFNSCNTQIIEYCDQAFASNCPITFSSIKPGDYCINSDDSLCFELANITLPGIGFNGIVDPNNYAINWNGNILNNDSVFCIKPTTPGNKTVNFIIYATDPTANCYVEGQLNVLVKDSMSDFSLQVEPLVVSSSQVTFGWNPVPNATGYIYDAFVNGGSVASSVITSDTFVSFTPPTFKNRDTVQILVKAFNSCDTIYDPDDTTVTVVAVDTCFIGKLKKPGFVANACAFDCYDLEVQVTSPATWTVEWLAPGVISQAPSRDNKITYCPPNDNTTDLVIFEIVDTAYSGVGTCSLRDTFIIDVAPKDIPNWDVKTEFCVTSFPYQINVDASPASGWFYMVGDSTNAVEQSALDGQWYFHPQRAGVGTHTLVFKVCGDSLIRTVNVGDIPCVTTIFNEKGARPDGIWTTCDGTIYYSDAGKNSIWSIDTLGTRRKILGDTTQAFRDFLITCPPSSNQERFRDGHRSFAKTIAPRGLVVIEGTRDIYFNDSYNHKIRKYIAATQEIITVAGPKTSAVSADIPANNSATPTADSLARFNYPWGMTMDCENNYIYFTDVKNQKLRRLQISEGGTFTAPFFVENVIGDAGLDINASTTGLNGRLGLPFTAGDVCGEQVPVFGSHPTMDGDDIYIPDPARSMMYRYNTTSMQVEPFVTPQFIPAYADGTLSFVGTGRTRSPVGSAIIPGADSVFFSDNQNFAIRSAKRIDDVSSELLTISGSPPPANISLDDDGPLFVARYGSPTAMRFSTDGYLYVCDAYGTPSIGAIRRIALTPELSNPFYYNDTIFCLNEPQDTLISVYAGGIYSVVQGDPSVLTQFGVSDTFFFNPIVADTFIIEYTANVGCCPKTWQQQFIVNGLPPVLLDSIVFSCDPATTVIAPDSINAQWTYSWLDSTNTEISTNDTLFGVGEGTYYLFVTDSITGCTGMDSTQVQVGFSDTLRVTGANTMCFGDSVLLSFDTTAFQNWWWNTGDSTHEIFATGSGDYIAFASVGACITTDTFRVLASPLPDICINALVDTSLGRWIVGTLAGDTTLGGSGNINGSAYNARFNQPWDVLYVDGFLYVTDAGNNLIKRIDLSDTTVSTYAGSTTGTTVDGSPRLSSQFVGPRGITYDKNTGDFYFISVTSNALLKIHNDSVFVVAGKNDFGGGTYAEGGLMPLTASFNDPKDIDIDVFGNVYIAGYTEQVIRKFNPIENSIFDIAGLAGSPGIVNGNGNVARFNWPWGIGRTIEGDFIIPTESHNIRKMDKDFNVSNIAGPGTLTAGYVDGPGSTARFDNPWNVYVCPQGNAYITDGNNASVRLVKPDGTTSTIAGSTPWGYQDGDQSIAKFWVPTGITANSAEGVMYVADRSNNLIRTIVKNKTITICEGLVDTLDASCSLTGSELDFYWLNVIGDTIRNATIVADTGGVFTFHVVNANGCYNFDSVIVNQVPSLIPNINGMTEGRLDSIFGCQGDTIILDADTLGAISYNWLGTSPFIGLTTDSIISTDTSGRYIVEITNLAGCSNFDTVDVIITPLPNVSFVDSNFCFGETYTIDMSSLGFDSIIWNSAIDTNFIIIDSTDSYIYEAYLNGCILTDTIDVIVSDSFVLDIGFDSLLGCEGDTFVLAAAPFGYSSYNWTSTTGSSFSGLASDSIIVVDTSGIFVVEVTDSLGCNAFDTVQIILAPLPIVNVLDSNLCFGETYTVDLSAAGFDSIVWNGNLNAAQVILDSTGSYPFEGFLNGCSLLDTVNIYVADSIFVDINNGNDTVYSCLGDSALLEATPNGFGSYLWSPGGETDSAIYITTAGTYSVIVTDSITARCIATDDVDVLFIASIDLNIDDTLYVCNSDTLVFSPSVGNLPSVAGGFIAWSTGDTIFNDNDSVTISSSGWFYAEAVLGTCTDYDSVYVEYVGNIILTPNVPSLNCGDDSLAIGGAPTASGGSGQGFIYQWQSSSPFAHFNDSTISNPIIVFDSSGSYTFTLTVYDSANLGCSSDTTFTFFTGLLPGEVQDLGPDTLVVCENDTVCFDFTEYNFDQIVWIFTDQNSAFLGLSQDDSICIKKSDIATSGNIFNIELNTVVDLGQGCIYPTSGSIVDGITIYFGDPITIDAGNDTSVCPLDTAILGGNPTAFGGSESYQANPFSYNWSANVGATPISIANPAVNPTATTEYLLTVTDTVAGCIERDTVNVNVYNTPSIEAGNDFTICAGDTAILAGLVTPFDTSLVISWSPQNGTLTDSSNLNSGAFPIDTTVYYLTVFDTIGCAALSDSMIINVNANPIADFIADTVCADTISTLTSSTIGSLSWSSAGFPNQVGSPVNFDFGTGGNYNVTLVADNGGCLDTITYTVTVDSIPNVYAGEDTSYCISDSVVLNNATSNGNVTWSSNSGGSFNNTGILNPTFTPDSTGTDTLNLYVVNASGCENSDQVILTFAPIPSVVAGNYNSGCSGTGILLSGATGVGSFNWTSSGDGTFDSTGILNANYLFGQNDLTDGSVILTLTATSAPCPSVSDTASIGIFPSAEAVITANVNGGGVVVDSLVEVFVDEGVTFDYLASLGYLPDSTGWDLDGDGDIDDFNDSYFQIFSNAGSSYIYLYASNENGCFDWDTIRIDVIGNQVVFIPNVFNPTDQINPLNATLMVFGTNVLDNDAFDFKLYNRWGELIFEESSFSVMNTIGWNGTHQKTGEDQALGVYTYTVTGQFRDGTTFEKVGNVTLIR